MHGNPDSIRSLGDKIGGFLAALLILAPVIVLHFLEDANDRLIVISSFTIAFTAALVFGTEASRAELFGASAAFVAVQVIYVGN